MEKKNTVLLTVIAVATLLVAVVGATFAYFTATNETSDYTPGTTNIDTASVGASLVLDVTTNNGSSNTIYPGTMNFVGATATAKFKDEESTPAKNYQISYNVTGSITLSETFTQDITWNLYETTDDLGTGVVTCQPVTAYTPEGGEAVAGSYTQSCSLAASLGTKSVASGTITAGTGADAATPVSYTKGTVVTGGATKHYYLVVSYPETGNPDQNADATGKKITISLDKVESTGSAVAS